MKFSSRFALAAIAVVAAFTTISCTSQSPSAPVSVNPTVQPGIGGSAERPSPMISPDDPIVMPCDVSLTGSLDDAVLLNEIPFSLSCENMGMATMTIYQTRYTKWGCLKPIGATGLVTFGDTGHQYSFSMQIKRESDCVPDGGTLQVCNILIGGCKVVRLPALTRSHSGLSQPAN